MCATRQEEGEWSGLQLTKMEQAFLRDWLRVQCQLRSSQALVAAGRRRLCQWIHPLGPGMFARAHMVATKMVITPQQLQSLCEA